MFARMVWGTHVFAMELLNGTTYVLQAAAAAEKRHEAGWHEAGWLDAMPDNVCRMPRNEAELCFMAGQQQRQQQ